jgi:hypothetical protein
MPIKKPNPRTNKKVRENTIDKRIVLFICGALLLVIVIVAYTASRRPLATTTKISSETTKEPVGTNNQITKKQLEYQAVVAKAKLQLQSVDNKDTVKVIVEKTAGAGNREIMYTYEWSINGQPAGSGSDSISGFKRGDKIAVKITPFDGEKPGKPQTLTLDVQNTTPKVSESKEPKYDGKMFTVQINASDPDGDELSYELLSGPQGMTIDNKRGILNWPVKDNNGGDYPIKVKIADGHGGEVIYQLTATIPKDIPQTATLTKKTP